MNKIFVLLLVVILLFSFAGCEGEKQADPTQPSIPQKTPDQGPEDVTDNPALAVLQNIWEQFQGTKDDYVGGSGAEYQTGAPWQVALSDTDFLQGALFLSEKQLQKVTAAASLMHGLNTNNLTVGAIALGSDTDYEAFAAEIKDRILQNQWVCGRPGGMRIVRVGECLLILYGSGSYSGSFVDALNEAYPEAEVLCRETI